MNKNESNLDSRARRAAHKAGLSARKSRARLSLNNLGDYRLVDANRNLIVAGKEFSMSAKEIIKFCENY